MSTITQIVTQIQAILDPLPDIDYSSISEYLPAAKTRRVALIIPPLGMSGTVDAPVGIRTKLVHRIPCEFWVVVHNGDLAASMNRGREICLQSAAELQATERVGSALNGTVTYLGEGEGSTSFEWAVEDNIINIGNASYIRALLRVTVTEWVTLQP